MEPNDTSEHSSNVESSESWPDENAALPSERLTSDMLEDLRGTRDGLLGIASGVGEEDEGSAGSLPTLPIDDTRLFLLSRAIERMPDAPSNYVMRGELLLARGDLEGARYDFEKAVELAETRAESANWGYINRALVDRAREGLKHCE
jgi:tetratricopeptide (TPR) repeat protein